MTFLKDNPNFKSRGVQDSPSFVGSLAPIQNFRGFATEALVMGSAGTLGKVLEAAVSGNRVAAGTAAAVAGLAAGEVLNRTGAGQFVLDCAISPVYAVTQLFSGNTTFESRSLLDSINTSAAWSPLFFQFFPETITDDRQVDFNEVSLPFLTNPIPTFVSASPRTIGFTLQFAQELWIPTGSGDRDSMKWTKHNFDVGLAVQSVRSFSYPLKGFFPQPLLLTLPGTRIGIDGDSIYCLLKGYGTQYEAFFPDGQPRLASMNLTFQEFTLGIDGPHGNITGASFNNVYRNYTQHTTRVIQDMAEYYDDTLPIPGKTNRMDSSI